MVQVGRLNVSRHEPELSESEATAATTPSTSSEIINPAVVFPRRRGFKISPGQTGRGWGELRCDKPKLISRMFCEFPRGGGLHYHLSADKSARLPLLGSVLLSSFDFIKNADSSSLSLATSGPHPPPHSLLLSQTNIKYIYILQQGTHCPKQTDCAGEISSRIATDLYWSNHNHHSSLLL